MREEKKIPFYKNLQLYIRQIHAKFYQKKEYFRIKAMKTDDKIKISTRNRTKQ